jgi:hypothetical protein
MRLLYSPLDALQNVGNPYVPFQLPVQKFLLQVIRSGSLKADPSVDWDWLARSFAAGLIYQIARQSEAPSICSAKFLSAVKQTTMITAMRNQYRQQVVKRIASAFEQAGLQIVFVKGAAEIIRFDNDAWHLSLRDMDDIDAICPPEQLEEAEKVMINLGYEIYDYDKPMPMQELRSWSIKHTGHYLFNPTKPEPVRTTVELHIQVATGRSRDAYPLGFSERVLERCEVIDFQGVPVRVPSVEDMLVYLLCHAALPKDHYVMFAAEEFYFDDYPSVSKQKDIDLVQSRWDWYQIWFLTRLRSFLNAAGTIDQSTVSRALKSVKNRRLLDLYLSLAAEVLGLDSVCCGAVPKVKQAKLRALILLYTRIWDSTAFKTARYKAFQAREWSSRRLQFVY